MEKKSQLFAPNQANILIPFSENALKSSELPEITSIATSFCTTCPNPRSFTFNESLKLSVLDRASLEINLQGHEQHEQEFVVFIQTSDRICENFIGQILNNICNSLLRQWRLFRSVICFLKKVFKKSLAPHTF